MKLITKSLLYMLPASMMLTLGSCSEYIDIDTEKTLDIAAIDYTATENMYEPVVGCYQRLRDQGMHWANAMIWMGRDDDMSSGRADDQGDALKFGYPGGYANPSAFWAVGNLWVTMYNIIIDIGLYLFIAASLCLDLTMNIKFLYLYLITNGSI